MSALFGSPPPSAIPHDWGVAPCLDLINSRWSDHLGRKQSYDRLIESTFLRAFLKRWHFKVGDVDDKKARTDLARLRSFLRRLLEEYSLGRPLRASARRTLESEMNLASTHLKLYGGSADLHVGRKRSGNEWDIVLSEIALSAARLIAEGKTVKVCANPNCSWMFVDESRPKTRRWCNSGVCGSLVNMRRYRLAHAKDRAVKTSSPRRSQTSLGRSPQRELPS